MKTRNVRIMFCAGITLSVFLFGVVTVGCTLGAGDGDDGQGSVLSSSLGSFDSRTIGGYSEESELLADLDAVGYLFGKSLIDSYIENWSYYKDWFGGLDYALSTDGSDGAVADTTESGNEADLADTDDTTRSDEGYATNVQVEGIDEADVVKSDGRRIFIAAGAEVVVLDLDGAILDRATVDGAAYFTDLLMDGDRILAIGTADSDESDRYEDMWYYWGYGDALLVLFDLAEDGTLTEADSTSFAGTIIDARLAEGYAYVVTSDWLDYSVFWEELSPDSGDLNTLTAAVYETRAYEKLNAIVPEWREEIVDRYFTDENGEVDTEYLSNTFSLYDLWHEDEDAPAFAGSVSFNYYIQVRTFGLDGGFDSGSRAGAFAAGWANGNIYADFDTLVVGCNAWESMGDDWEQYTHLLLFDIGDGTAVPYSTAIVEGGLLNQFSLDIYDDHLRVATTKSAKWAYTENQEWEIVSDSESLVTVFSKNSGEMVQTGQVRGLGITETIYAMRFMGDRGFAVTFRQMDPFYTLDLSDHTDPRVVGELKIPGFSNYLHPVGDDYILGIGQDADEEGWTEGVKVSLFDVSNMAAPLELYSVVLDENTYSDAQWDHHAFRYVPSRELLVLPVSRWSWDGYVAAFLLFDVSVTEGIDELGAIDHSPVGDYWWGYYGYLAPRSLVYTDSDTIVTMRSGGVKASDLDSLQELWEVELFEGLSEYEWYAYPEDDEVTVE